MPTVSDAKDRLESGIEGAEGKYRSGIDNPERNPSEGLNEYDISNFDEETREEFDSHWSERASNSVQDFVDSGERAANKWEQNWGDANNWDIGDNGEQEEGE